MLKVKNIQKSYGTLPVLIDASFSLGKGQKAALIGSNGTGKTTLLMIIAGLEKADAGFIDMPSNYCIGYLPQDTSLNDGRSVIEYLKSVTEVGYLERKIESLLNTLDNIKNQEEYAELYERYEHLGGYSFEAKMAAVLAGLGLRDISTNQLIINLSSGQKSKVALAGILLKGVDLLLLDEPTNNLDLPALIWLENFLKKSEASCLLVSHDRYFLDRTVRKVLDLNWHTKKINITNGTYSDYLKLVNKNLEKGKEKYKIQQAEIGRLTDRAKEKKNSALEGANFKGTDNDKFIKGFKRDQSAKSSRVAKNIEKRIEKIDKIERPIERDKLSIDIKAEKLPGNLEIDISNVLVGYPTGFKISPFSLRVGYGERVGIMGLNGSGKSTILKAITGLIKPIQGSVTIGSGLRIGNMMQEHETLPRDEKIVDFIAAKVSIDKSDIYTRLTQFGFQYEQLSEPISTLSPGGRARLIFALFEMSSINTLILDEPTNHLDIEALEALEDVLSTFSGTVIIVSHDRALLEKANLETIYKIDNGNLEKILSYYSYLEFAEKQAQKLLKMLP